LAMKPKWRMRWTAEDRRAARRDGAHHPLLDATEMSRMNMAISLAMAAQNVRDLEIGTAGA
jgi:hypothetical protein